MAALEMIAEEYSIRYTTSFVGISFYEPFRTDIIAAADLGTLTNNSCEETTRRLLVEFFCYVTQQW